MSEISLDTGLSPVFPLKNFTLSKCLFQCACGCAAT